MIFLTHLVGLIVTAAISGGAAWWVHRKTDDRSGTVMVAILLEHLLMALFAIGLLTARTVPMMTLWGTLVYTLVASIPALWLLFAVYYTGREYWLTKPAWIAIAVLAIVPAGLVFTNVFHDLLLVEYGIVQEPVPHLQYEQTTLMKLLMTVVHLPAFFGFGLLLRTLLFSRRNTRWQLLALLVGMSAIVVASGIVNTELAPIRGFAYGVYGAGVFGLLVAVALFRTELFAVAPLARDMLFDSIDDVIVVVDADRRIVDFNEIAADLFPKLADRAGDRIDDVYPALVSGTDEGGPDGDDTDSLPDRLSTPSTAPFAGTISLTTDDGHRTYRVTVHDIASGGEPRGYGLIVRDVTELEAYAADLEAKTDQLEQFASVLSHDLRNPVTVALGYVDLERERRDSPHLQEATEALKRIDETIEDLLTLSREGESIDDPELVSLRSVVEDAWTTSDTDAAVLETEVDDGMYIQADSSRLRTMFENLFRNAADHGGETVRVGPLEDEGGFFVEDDGPGIPEDERDTVFEHGYTTRENGTGFGLAIVDSIVTAHGWSIAVTEGEGGGARFEVSGVEEASVPTETGIGASTDDEATPSSGR